MKDDQLSKQQAVLKKIHDWLSRQADRSEQQAKTCGYESLANACRADAKNYRAVCAEIEAVLKDEQED